MILYSDTAGASTSLFLFRLRYSSNENLHSRASSDRDENTAEDVDGPYVL
jgi:hypothetical protein